MLAPRWIRVIVVAVAVLIVQLELIAPLQVFGVHAELMLGLTVAAAWHGGSGFGAAVGFTTGALFDLYLASPFGLTAMTYGLVGFALGSAAEVLADSAERIVARLMGIGATAGGLVLFAVLGGLFGEPSRQTGSLLKTVVVATLLTGPAMPVLRRLAVWATDDGSASFRSSRDLRAGGSMVRIGRH